jgi:outer membrane protein assembly factor BamA
MNAETHVTIEQVTIDGVDAVIQKKILASMGFIDKTPIAIDTDWPNKIKETLEAIGYFDAIVKLRSTSKKSNVQDQTHLNMDIHLGTPVRIRHSTIRIIGSDTFVLPELSLTSGNILNMHDYKQSKNIIRYRRTRGVSQRTIQRT